MEEQRMGAFGRFRRRRHYVLDRELQFKLLGVSLVHVLFTIGIAGVCLFVPAAVTLLRSPAGSERGLESATTILYLHSLYWPAGLLSLVAVCLDSIRVTHRIAGPLYRFRRVLDDVVRGRPTQPVHLRRGDFLQREAGRINEGLVHLERARSRRADALVSCERIAAEIRAIANQDRSGVDTALLRGWERELRRVSALIDNSAGEVHEPPNDGRDGPSQQLKSAVQDERVESVVAPEIEQVDEPRESRRA